MIAASVFFYIFALLALLLALAVVISPHILRSTLYLAGMLFCGAAFYTMLNAEFLAGIQLLVYIGGVSVLLIFAIMLTNSRELLNDRATGFRRSMATLGSLAFFMFTAKVILDSRLPAPSPMVESGDQIQGIGLRLLSTAEGGLVLPFELISVLLLVAAIAGIFIARMHPAEGEEQ